MIQHPDVGDLAIIIDGSTRYTGWTVHVDRHASPQEKALFNADPAQIIFVISGIPVPVTDDYWVAPRETLMKLTPDTDITIEHTEEEIA